MRAMQGNGSKENEMGWFAEHVDLTELADDIKQHAARLGFAACGIARADVDADSTARLQRWLAAGRHGDMDYMAKHAALRADPRTLLHDALSVISVRLPYWPQAGIEQTPASSNAYNISRYAFGRDYHKSVRQRLQKLGEFIQHRLREKFGETDAPLFSFRACTDSAPVMETEFAQRAGVGWRGKHTLTLAREGSWHFLGELFTNLPLPVDLPAENHCGRCQRCIDACPTKAIIAPFELDARLCISYLTIELPGAIPVELRPLIGNRIYGCDDCQQYCPWNRFAKTGDPDFAVRNNLERAPLSALFAWNEDEFLQRLAGSPIRRIGHERWLRNIAVALGNAPQEAETTRALISRANDNSMLVREHVSWALTQQSRLRANQECVRHTTESLCND